jgi:hydroxypyruvate reductase
MAIHDLRSAALDIFAHALCAVDAGFATRKAITLDGSKLRVFQDEFDIADRPVYVVGMGKAASSMTIGLHEVLGGQIAGGVISTAASPGSSSLPATYETFLGGHPLPNQQSLAAAQAALNLLDRANDERAVVIFLVSGGGSAMLEAPISDDITLEDLQQSNQLLITSGATISEINSVRRAISAVKGGGLAERAPKADVVTLIVSDTNAGDESSVASGPTISPPADALPPADVIAKYGLDVSLPPRVVKAVQQYKPETNVRFASHYVLLSNSDALRAAAQRARELGFETAVAFDISEQSVNDGATLMLSRTSEIKARPCCLISGGEFACRVHGDGRGGRNLETVLRFIIKLHDEARKDAGGTVILSAGSDGIDGSSFAAGAIGDDTTIGRAHELELNPIEFLQQSDSHGFFDALGNLIVTGPTGTNVRDIRIVIRG